MTLTNETTDMAHLKRLLWGHYKNEVGRHASTNIFMLTVFM